MRIALNTVPFNQRDGRGFVLGEMMPTAAVHGDNLGLHGLNICYIIHSNKDILFEG